MFLIDQPERFYTINFILSSNFQGYSLVLILGLILLLFVILFYLFKRNKISKYLLIIIFIFWLPSYAISFYNNFYDLMEDFEYSNLNNEQKSKLRLGNMSDNKASGSAVYSLIDYSKRVKENLDYNSNVHLISRGALSSYLKYYLYPEVRLINNINSTDFLLIYHPEIPIILRGNKLYLEKISEENFIGNYSMIFCTDSNKCLLKKI